MTKRVTIVTGAARGLGAAIAQRLAARGDSVACLDLDRDGVAATAQLIQNQGGSAVSIVADVSDPDHVCAAIAETVARLGPPGILVNNAGLLRDSFLYKMTTEDWDVVMAVHLRGTFLMTQAAQGHMVSAGWGRIVNLSSTSALGNRGQANYAAAKAGIQGFTRSVALELGKFGITANAVAPGVTDTAMTRAAAERLGVPFAEYEQRVLGSNAIPRAGQPADVANAVEFFTGEDAGYVSGQVLYVAGGPVQ